MMDICTYEQILKDSMLYRHIFIDIDDIYVSFIVKMIIKKRS